MDSQLHLHTGLANHRPLRPNLYSTKSATRVTSDPEKKAHSKHKSHHHHRDRHDHDRHSSSRRQAAKEAVQLAIQIQPPTSFGDLLRQARGSRDTSPSHSRRESIAPGQVDGNGNGKEEGAASFIIPPRRRLRPEDVELEGKRVATRERDLRTALQSLSDQSLKTSRRLDDTYYSILEKVSGLRQTIGTIQELSSLTRELHDNFESDTTELIEDVSGQVDAFDGFKTQQEHVTGLEERIKAGKEKADTLTARLAQAKERVDARAKSEALWQAKNTQRMRIFWGTLGSIVAVIVAVILFHHFKPTHVAEEPKATLDFASRSVILEAPIPDIAKEAVIGPSTTTASSRVETSFAKPLLEDDERLRGFDEL
ncbi:hypothetical protein EJ02DRAFT_442808 [Clathrospora elynae]|uniref:Uncharacterized protein n=1 Tax=Clathrospora elynae TaxID=706981 RepID=A0A6A5SWC9_9PLEO|nr:hypothetical protein EJ02DRAFT_442808 [Clathrospora elynae]